MGEKELISSPGSFSSGHISLQNRDDKGEPHILKEPVSSRKVDPGMGHISNDLLVIMERIMDSCDMDDLMKVIREDISLHLPYEMGTLKWKVPEDNIDDWGMDPGEEFSESRDFISNNYALTGASELNIEDGIECQFNDPWIGGMDGLCRARTRAGDPVLIRLRSALVIPLHFRNERVGIMLLYSSKEAAFEGVSESNSLKMIWNTLGNMMGFIIEREDHLNESERTRKLLDSTEDLLVLWRRSGSLWEIESNRKADSFINRPELLPEMIEGPFFAPPGKEWERGMFAWTRAFENGEAYQVDLELVDIMGTNKPYLCTFTPYVENEERIGVMMTGIEIARINEAVCKLEKMNNSYRLLISLLSHDLKNPLSAIMGYSELLKFASEDKKEPYINKITGLTSRMSATIEMVKLLSQIQEGKLKKDLETMDVSSMVKRSIDTLYPKTEAYDISFDLDGEDFQITGHTMLEQVMVNLLDNAMKYSPEGSRIKIDLTADISGLTFSIEDQGEGVPDEYRKTIFQRFERGKHRDGIAGTGLGLAISKGIIEMHEGTIWNEDNPKGGSIFKFNIPWTQN